MKIYSRYSYTIVRASDQVRYGFGSSCTYFCIALSLRLTYFFGGGNSQHVEITTLIVKSMFPVHPIAAAIQSVYVCRRDLEKDPTIGLGRIVLPSVVFHGTYDFALLAITSSWQKDQNYFYQVENVTGVAIVSFCVSLFMVIAGGLYYMRISRAQYARLRGESDGTNALSEASFNLLL